jgi:uncharacterized protein
MKFLKYIFLAPFFILIIGFSIYYIIDLIQTKNNLMDIEEYSPRSTLVIPENIITKAKYPFVDVHNHIWNMPIKDLSDMVKEMDEMNMGFIINLSGSGIGTQALRNEFFSKSISNIKDNFPNRFGLFVNVDFERIDEEGFAQMNVDMIKDAVSRGAMGLKIYKSLGLTSKDAIGNRIAVNDIRLDPIWNICGELGIPVLIHSGEPASFWKPKDKYNERWLELRQKPSRYRDPLTNPSFEEVLAEQHDIFRKHKNTTFINAHLGWMGNDLERLRKHLDEYPNVITEIAAVIAELGRQPIFARQFFIDYQDRILFGKDTYNVKEYHLYFRVLETADEHFDYFRKRHAHWRMYGLNLPDEVLKKVYYKNALKLFPNIPKDLFID